ARSAANGDGRGRSYRAARGEILGSARDGPPRKRPARTLPSIENDAALANSLPVVAEAGGEAPLLVTTLDEYSVARVVGGYPVWGVEAGERFRLVDGRLDALRLSRFVHLATTAYASSRVRRFGEESD
ncbi:MAG: hypothetical protein B7W95_00380, partial [Acidimicrobiales bacterium 20-64-4]